MEVPNMQEEIFPLNQQLRTSSAQMWTCKILHMSDALNGDTRYTVEAVTVSENQPLWNITYEWRTEWRHKIYRWGCHSFREPASMKSNKTKLHGLSPRENHIDRETAACRRSDCHLFADRVCHVVRVTDPYGRILGFLDRSRYFSIK
jgi:hypothetical protein